MCGQSGADTMVRFSFLSPFFFQGAFFFWGDFCMAFWSFCCCFLLVVVLPALCFLWNWEILCAGCEVDVTFVFRLGLRARRFIGFW